MERLFKAGELADKLKVSKQTVWRWGREGKLKTLKVGRTVRFCWEGETSD